MKKRGMHWSSEGPEAMVKVKQGEPFGRFIYPPKIEAQGESI